MARRWPKDPEVQLLHIESILRDRNDPVVALAAIGSLPPPADPRLRRNLTTTQVYALLASGRKDSARLVLDQLARDNPASARFKALLDSIK